MNLRIIHIGKDEKFINSAHHQFETVAPGRNIFYIFSALENDSLQHVERHKNIEVVSNTPAGKNQIVAAIKPQDIVIFHSLSPSFYEIAISLPKSATAVWFCFGFEVYNDTNYYKLDEGLGPQTLKVFAPDKPLNEETKLKDRIRPLVRALKKDVALSPSEVKSKAMKRMDYLGSSFAEEFEAISNRIRMKKRFFDFWYYPINQIVNLNDLDEISKDSILIGNSGYIMGNHLDVFDALKDFDLINFNKIIVPLGYGEESYIVEVSNKGKEYFKDKFVPITSFLPLEEYNNYLKSAAIAIFNNRRQQAVGNILALLWFGSKVYLSSKNPFYDFLIRNNCIVYDVDIEFAKRTVLEPLNIDQQNHNRSIISDLFSEEKLLKSLSDQLQFLKKQL